MAIREDILLNTDKRLFYISNDIDNETMGKMCFNLLYLLQEDDNKEAKEKEFKREPIKIYINSYGGNVYDMWSLIDIILNAKSPIYTYCTGYAMSAAWRCRKFHHNCHDCLVDYANEHEEYTSFREVMKLCSPYKLYGYKENEEVHNEK